MFFISLNFYSHITYISFITVTICAPALVSTDTDWNFQVANSDLW